MKHPYEDLPDERRWSQAVANRPDTAIDPVGGFPTRIRPQDLVVSAGSCFAQRITHHMEARGRYCERLETAHPLLEPEVAEAYGYGTYAARYGNIYTPRQLLQLWRRATGAFVPRETYWQDDGAFYDPFRSTIQPGGFASLEELEADRAQHFRAVVDLFTRMDVFIFTLGLSECWGSAEDGAVYPLCPGVVSGTFVPGRHVQSNFSAAQMTQDLRTFIEEVREVNPELRVILTVSPQPQMVTTEERHVVVEAGSSKARLRIAAEEACALPDVFYFPSYEISTLPGSHHFTADRRTLEDSCIERVMHLFFRHVVEEGPAESAQAPGGDQASAEATHNFVEEATRVIQVLCDEDFLDSTEEETNVLISRIFQESDAAAPVTEAESEKMRARRLAIEGDYAQAISIVEKLYRDDPRPGLAWLLDCWRAAMNPQAKTLQN